MVHPDQQDNFRYVQVYIHINADTNVYIYSVYIYILYSSMPAFVTGFEKTQLPRTIINI